MWPEYLQIKLNAPLAWFIVKEVYWAIKLREATNLVSVLAMKVSAN